ncbi:DNA repair ATPase [Pseudomonas saudimassiliensis]|uniref:DNA repair ATPase n=1 Tax=Pseudomonas saudimassiliensis TaxID=1461581 RepID=A0A078M3N5_9PSED|nr:DUF2959 domain-containing protein [Pseudomonas saudimassiliensis]CEA00850.1 DNA repair ATPase [Pseudomonas saudimassiliensis]CEF25292.1 DNA repair ATPase [Pseudomonas saudimassiliensis]
MSISRWFLGALLVVSLAGCQSAYYSAMEKVGVHKRDIMVNRVESVQEAQTDAKEQFESALAQFRSIVQIKDQDLAARYDKLNDEYEDSKAAAKSVTQRIDAVEDVSEALFDEWEDEIELYSNANLKRQSAAKLSQTRRQYQGLIKAMRSAETRMAPVLRAFQDQVLFLKHNLNARAIDSLQGELGTIETDVAQLIREMEKSIAESEAFIRSLQD